MWIGNFSFVRIRNCWHWLELLENKEFRGFSSDRCCCFVAKPRITQEGLSRCIAIRSYRLLLSYIFHRSKRVLGSKVCVGSMNLKVHFPRWHIGPVLNRSILMHYLKLTPCIQLKNQKIKTLNVSFVIENSPKIHEEQFGLRVSAVLSGRSLDCTRAEYVQYICYFYK